MFLSEADFVPNRLLGISELARILARHWARNFGSTWWHNHANSVRVAKLTGYRSNCSAMATALSSAEALLTVSWYSDVGTESATTPAPAWI
jgi:hypothetical protein